MRQFHERYRTSRSIGPTPVCWSPQVVLPDSTVLFRALSPGNRVHSNSCTYLRNGEEYIRT